MNQRITRVGFIGLGGMGRPMANILHASALFLFLLFARLQEGLAETVKIAIPSTTQAVLPFTIARDKGYYRVEGLDVELILVSAPIASRALLSGDVTVATVGGAGLPPVLRGSPFKFLFTTYNRAMFWLYVKPEIRDVKGLKNKRVGVSGIGSGPDSLLREILRQNGLDPNRDVTVRLTSLGFASWFHSRSRIWLSCKAAFLSETRRCNPTQRRWRNLSAALTKDFFISKRITRQQFPSLRVICRLMKRSPRRRTIKWSDRR